MCFGDRNAPWEVGGSEEQTHRLQVKGIHDFFYLLIAHLFIIHTTCFLLNKLQHNQLFVLFEYTVTAGRQSMKVYN